MTCTHAALKRKDLVDLAFRVWLCMSVWSVGCGRGDVGRWVW